MAGQEESDQRRRPVQASAARLRELVLAREAGAQIGSLREVADLLGVGIVTVQQAARILEHEGLLVVRRGPGGGYYGARPDDAALERSMAAWLRVHGSAQYEALEMNSLLEGEMVAAATQCDDEALRKTLFDLAKQLDDCGTTEARVAFEKEFNALLFRMVDRPLIELLARVTLRYYETQPLPALFSGEEGTSAWRNGRRRTLEAILQRDEALARFEANRHRQEVLKRLRSLSMAER